MKEFAQQGLMGSVALLSLLWGLSKDRKCEKIRDKYESKLETILLSYLDLKHKVERRIGGKGRGDSKER